eukprot:TRINITY_DN12000_c0_g1_i1.p1 TRINITY_DN12000_c0_g1~~TRINITY_DN12000_c0_g1_i1.p1  ORF type:complete len:343 (-),score=23.63 TRINITY_DN12000_c0_g1_i1:36-1064(-)
MEEGGNATDGESAEETIVYPDQAIADRPRTEDWMWWAGMCPVILVFILFGYPYVVLMRNVLFVAMYTAFWPLALLGMLVGTISLVFCLWCYVQTVRTIPGYVPRNWGIEDGPLLRERTLLGEKRICKRCGKVKPDRSHHCSICRKCILRMDHHCPWVNNCVGHYNYKFFILFLTYTPIAGVVSLLIALPHLIFAIDYSDTLELRDIHVFIATLITGMFGIGLASFAGMHYNLALKNLTTLEAMDSGSRKPIRTQSRRSNPRITSIHPYDLGNRKNFEQVFGKRILLWPLPLQATQGNGLRYQINSAYANALAQESEEEEHPERTTHDEDNDTEEENEAITHF